MSTVDAEKSDSSPSPSPNTVVESVPSAFPPPGSLSPTSPSPGSLSPTSPSPGSLSSASAFRSSGPAPARRTSSTIPPGPSDALLDIYGQRDDEFSPERALDEQIAELEAWAAANLAAERVDSLRFWGMRVLAFLGAGAAAAAAALEATELAASAGVFAAFAIVVDTAWPTTSDRMARRRAIRDLREMQHNLKLKWDKVRLAHPNPNAPKRIAHSLVLLDQIQAKREEIGRYLGDASPGVSQKLG